MSEKCHFDVLVAGGGPAGTVVAYHLARMGFRVALFEQRSWDDVWGKPCGDAIGAHHFRNAGLPQPPQNTIRNVIHGVLIYSPSLEAVYRVRGEGFIVNRRELGRWLLSEAEKKGAEIILESHVVAPIVEEGFVKGLRVKLRDGKSLECRAKVVIEATGYSMAVKRRLPSEWPVAEPIDPRDTNIAYREIHEYNIEINEPDYIRIYLDPAIAPGGYWWFFPESRSQANVGLGVQGGVGNPPPQRNFRLLLEKGLVPRPKRVLEKGGAVVPTRRPQDTLVWNGIVVLGDAAYTVNPVHGGGIGYAFYSAYLASKTIAEAFEKGCFTAECLWRLNVEYMHSLGAKQASLDIFRLFLQRLSRDDIEFGMRKRLIPEVDVYDVSTTGELKVSVVEKAMILLRGLSRPTLLAKLKLVADYMRRVKEHYQRYPESPSQLDGWRRRRDEIYDEFLARLGGW